jgi:hypothetical protein
LIRKVGFSLITQNEPGSELLIHLISNSRQARVCGPEGIGKSTLIKVCRTQVESWLYCLVQGNVDLSFERFKQTPSHQSNFLTNRFGFIWRFRLAESQHRKIVLMIDEAGHFGSHIICSKYNREYTVKNRCLQYLVILF